MELLAPAGNWEAFLAAVHNGADAVYLGGKDYSARQSADNFDLTELARAIDYAHLKDKKVYVTVNTLMAENEMNGVLDYLYELYERQVDAVIVQDIGMISLARQVLPDLHLHASTQMTVHNAAGAEFLHELGIKRTVLARECSFDDIKLIHGQVPDAELEVFVHGALCYSYSGQCLFSSLAGGRSGNRGRCAQPCRLSYELFLDGKNMRIPDRGRYLLSPADLCLIDFLPMLQDLQISSLKIEGRMKRPEYVATVTRAYREALDRLQSEGAGEGAGAGAGAGHFRSMDELKDDLRAIFNRNFSSGYFVEADLAFLSDKRPNNRGIYVGRVLNQGSDGRTSIRLTDSVHSGDGLTVWVSKGKNPSCIVRNLRVSGKKAEEAFKGDIIQLELNGKVHPDDRVFKTHDAELLNRANASIHEKEIDKIPVDARVVLKTGQLMELILDSRGEQVEVKGKIPVEAASKQPLSYEVLRAKLERMGNTPFELCQLEVLGDLEVILPFSEINEVRRRATEMLEKKIKKTVNLPVDRHNFVAGKHACMRASGPKKQSSRSLLSVMTNGYDQAKTALKNGADRVYIGMEGVGIHRRITREQVQALWDDYGMERVILSMPRIHKPSDRFNYREFVEKSQANSVMLGNIGDLNWAVQRAYQIYGDYSLNIYNPYAQDFYMQYGLGQVCLSPELTLNQLQSFNRWDATELLIHGEIILMVSEHCMIGDMLGNRKASCNAPCTKGAYSIKDEKGYIFPVSTDADCRFYVFNARTLCMIDDIKRLMGFKPQSLRIEGRHMGKEELQDVVRAYHSVIQHGDGAAMKEKLQETSGSEFTKGHYYRGVV